MIDRWFACGLLIASGSTATVCARADTYVSGWYRELQLSVVHDDNVSRASLSRDRIADTVGSFSLGIGHSGIVGDAGKLIVSGYLQYSNHDKVGAISNTAASVGIRYIFQEHPGYRHVWYDTSVDVTRFDYRNSDARNGYLLRAAASINRRLSGRVTGRFGYRFYDAAPSSDEDEYTPFDTSRHEFFVGGDYRLGGNAWLYAEYSRQHGSFTSSASETGVPASSGYGAIGDDPALEGCGDGTCEEWYAYRYKGDMDTLELGTAFSLRGVDYDFSARLHRIHPDVGPGYHDASLQLGASFDF